MTIEIVQIKNYEYKIRSQNNKNKYYTIIRRIDETYNCNCNSFKYYSSACKHIKALKEIEK